MLTYFDERKYNFIDSIIEKICIDDNLTDFLIKINYYQGKLPSKNVVLRLKNVKSFYYNTSAKNALTDIRVILTIANISLIKSSADLQKLIIDSAYTFMPNHEDDMPLISCICEGVFMDEE